jgi:2',3'-cyclic-nucleotide 2'-phosphodiesterase (5'-nucleotidase family)
MIHFHSYLNYHRSMKPEIATILILLLLLFIAPAYADNTAEVLILHTNDFHGQVLPMEDKNLAAPPETVSGAAYMATKIGKLKRKFGKKVLLIDAGDIAQGTPISNMSLGKPVVEYMNYVGYDAMAPGNHEFDWGFAKMKEMVKQATFPVLCANIVDSTSGKIPPPFKPYAIFERDGVKIGLIGVITPATVAMTKPGNIAGLTFLQPEEPIKTYMAELHQKGVKVIGLLSHLGIEEDRKVPEKIQGLSFIVGGHSHTALQKTEKVGTTYIVQSGSSGKYLGNFHLLINRDTGAIVSCTIEHELIPVIDKGITPDKEVEKMLAPYYEKVKAIMNTVIGKASEDMLNKAPAGYGDTPLGNFLTDAIKSTYHTDVVIYNTEGIRAPLYKGDITSAEVFAMLPFDNEIMTLELTGEQLKEALGFFIEKMHYVQVSGLTFTYYPNREKGTRIDRILVGGKPLEPGRIYKLGTVDFLYYTTEDSNVMRKGKKPTFDKIARTMLAEYIEKNKNVGPPGDRRITIVKE